jgi:hypothetical protein
MKFSFLKGKKRKILFHLTFIFLISFFFQIFLFEAIRFFNPTFNKHPEEVVHQEKFDPSLNRLNSLSTFEAYCDSVYGNESIAIMDSGNYANIVSRTIRYRFVHGYSYYKFGHNYIATLLAPVVHPDLSAIVVPDDILNYPQAACSQQSIVAMKLLMDKGFLVRKVGFFHPTTGGHFCYEVHYENSWHFYDPNREPDEIVLAERNRPSIQFLNDHKDVLYKAYPKDSAAFLTNLYGSFEIGKEGKLPGRNAILFQTATQILSYTLWIFIGLLYIFIRRRLAKKSY